MLPATRADVIAAHPRMETRLKTDGCQSSTHDPEAWRPRMTRSARGVVAKAAALFALVAITAFVPQPALAQQRANPGSDGPGGSVLMSDARVLGLQDIAIDKRHTANFTVGQNGSYDFVVTNLGTAATVGAITLVDTLPNGLTFIDGAGTGWTVPTTRATPSGLEVTTQYANPLAVNDSAKFTLTVGVLAAAQPSVTNFATAITSGDLNPTNDRDGDLTVVGGFPDLAIDKRHNRDFKMGVKDTFTIVVTNLGALPTTTTTVVSDTLRPGLSEDTGTLGTGWVINTASQRVTATYAASIAPGDSAKFQIVVTVLQAAYPSVTNKATVRLTGGADLNAVNDVDTDSVNVIGTAELSIQKGHVAPNFTVGKNGSYQLTALNTGVIPAPGPTVVVDSLPRGLKFVSATGAGWTFSVNAPDSNIVTATRASVVNVNQPANFNITVHVGPTAFPADTNIATISGTSDALTNNNRATSPTAILGAPDLSLDKRHIAAFTAGQTGTYDFVVRNGGIIATFDSIKVTDVLPNGLAFVSGSGAGWNISSPDSQTVKAFRLPAPALAVGDSTKFSITVNVTAAALPSVINTATVSTTNDYDPSNDSDSDSTTVSGTPDLTIDKRHTAAFTVGQNGAYALVVTNVGPVATVQPTTVIDSLPRGLSFVPVPNAPWLVGVSGPVVSASYPNPIAAGDSVTFALTVAVSAGALPSVVNSALVSNPDDVNAANDRDSDPTIIASVPDLTLDKRHTTAFSVGQNGVYTFVVTNVGVSPSTANVIVTDNLPPGLTYVTDSGAPWSVNRVGQNITATLPSTSPIVAGDSSKFTLTVAVAAGAFPLVTNSATVATAGDLNPSNDSDSDPAAVTGAPDLTIDKRHIAPFAQGQLGLYTIVVRNVGNVPAAGTPSTITVTDTLPTGLTFSLGGSGGTGWLVARLGRVVTATFAGTIAVGDSAKFDLEVNVLATAPPGKTNVATVSGGGDTSPGNNTDSDPTAIAGTPDLTIDKRHTTRFVVGQPGVYTLVVRNIGNDVSAGPITVRDSLPAGLTYFNAAGAGWTVGIAGQVFTAKFAGSIAIGDSARLTLTCNVLPAAAPSVTNTATVSGAGDASPLNNTDSDVTGVTGTPELAIDKRHIGPFRLNNSGTYSFVVTNLAAAPSAGTVTVTDTLPAGLTYLFGTGTGWDVGAAGQIVTARHDDPIAGGDSARFTIVVTIGNAALPSVTNSAVVSGGGDATPANNRDTDGVQITGRGVLIAGKTASPTDIEVGGMVDFAVTASNIGDGPIASAEIVDVLPEGLRYVGGSARLDGVVTGDPVGAPGPQLRFPLGTLIAGAKVGLTYRVTVGSGSELGSGRNVALVQGTDPVTRRSVASNVAAATVVIRPGVFGDEGIIAGKVFADCDCAGDGLQGNEDLGIPGVRLYLEDGTSAVTDVEGKYSFNHVRPRLHVVRIDETTLPAGARMKAIANRNAGSGISQFVDLKRGEFHRVDFAEGSRSAEVLATVKARRKGGEVGGAIFGEAQGDRGDDSGAGPGPVSGGGTGSAGGRNSGRPSLLALGLLNARLDWYHLTNAKLMGSRHDRFEDELNDLSHESDDGTSRYAGRAALFLNGMTGDSVRVSLRYDSERDTERRLFRDIRPDEGYAMLGDASVHGFEAQSAGRLFARAERNSSFAQYGDFSTPVSPARSLGAFSRRLNGGIGNLVLGRTEWGGFASQGHQRQVIDEFRAQGISGPYTLSRTDGTLGSELVEVITRDRNQPARIINRVSQVRFVDYTLEAFTGKLVFRHPIASIDEQFNPVFIRVTYESDQAVDKFWVYGAQARVTPIPALSIGGAASQDEDPLLKRSIVSGDATLRLGTVFTLTGEVARSDSGQSLSFSDVSPKSGKASRLEAVLATKRLGLKLRTLRTDINFENPSSGSVAGREEQGFDFRGGLGGRTTLFGNGLRTRNLATDGLRRGTLFGISEALPHRIGMEAIWRWSKEGAIPASALSGGTVPSTSSSLGGKLTLPLPWIKNGTVFGEGEQEMTWYNRHRFAVGGDIQVTQKTRLFVRHENVASLSGPFALNDFQQQENTVVGLASDDFRNGHVFSEYRMRDAAAGREAQAAMGLRNRWALPDGWFVDAGLERVIIVRGGSGASMAVTSALEYTGSPLWKGSVRGEWRRLDTNDQWLSGMTMERKLSRNLAALGRTDWFRNIGDGRTDGRSQFGVAYRGTETNRLSLLARYDNRIEYMNGTTYYNRVTHVLSSHANWQPRDKVTLSGQLASKWARDDHDGIFSTNSVKLVAARALLDLTPKFDVGALGRTEFGGGLRYGVGGELGYLAARNMRLAAGYNLFGYGAADMLGEQRTDRGPYLDFGYKFDPFWGGPSHDAGSGASR